MASLESRAIKEGRSIDGQWLIENETNEFKHTNTAPNQHESSNPTDYLRLYINILIKHRELPIFDYMVEKYTNKLQILGYNISKSSLINKVDREILAQAIATGDKSAMDSFIKQSTLNDEIVTDDDYQVKKMHDDTSDSIKKGNIVESTDEVRKKIEYLKRNLDLIYGDSISSKINDQMPKETQEQKADEMIEAIVNGELDTNGQPIVQTQDVISNNRTMGFAKIWILGILTAITSFGIIIAGVFLNK